MFFFIKARKYRFAPVSKAGDGRAYISELSCSRIMKLALNLGQNDISLEMSYQWYTIWLIVDERDKMRLVNLLVDPSDMLEAVAPPFQVRFRCFYQQFLYKTFHFCITCTLFLSLGFHFSFF